MIESDKRLPGGSDSEESSYNAGDPGLISGLGRSPGEGNGNPLQYSCLENPNDRGAGQATVHRVTKSWTRLSNFTYLLFLRLKAHNSRHNQRFLYCELSNTRRLNIQMSEGITSLDVFISG